MGTVLGVSSQIPVMGNVSGPRWKGMTKVQTNGERVKLSKTEQAQLLEKEGATIEQIAAILNLDIKTIRSYLKINTQPIETSTKKGNIKIIS
jgi:DNA-binding CsgD family transcriptional regulator